MKHTDWLTDAAVEIAELLQRDDYITSIRLIIEKHAPPQAAPSKPLWYEEEAK